jgi:hypothetical protein
VTSRTADVPSLAQLRARVQGMQAGIPQVPLAMPAELSGLVRLRTGGSYRVDDPGLALALLAAPSKGGEWVGLVGIDDLGVEAAEESGLNLDRTVVVPDPGDAWLEVVAALVDVLPVVLLRAPARVSPATASRLSARLRKRSAVLLVQGEWPGCEARLSVAERHWYGATAGRGRLLSRRVVVTCHRGSAPPTSREMWLPAEGAGLQAIAGQEAEHGVMTVVEEVG